MAIYRITAVMKVETRCYHLYSSGVQYWHSRLTIFVLSARSHCLIIFSIREGPITITLSLYEIKGKMYKIQLNIDSPSTTSGFRHFSTQDSSNKSLKIWKFNYDWFRFMVFNATFNNISILSQLSVLLVEKTRVHREIS